MLTSRLHTRVFLALVLLTACLGVRGSAAAGLVFRYLPGAPTRSSAVVMDGVETGPYLDPRALAARGPGGWGLRAPWTAEFAGAGSTLRSEGVAAFEQVFGPQLTVEVWAELGAVAGRTVLLTNRVGEADGFTLGVEDGVPFFTVVVEGQAYTVQASGAVQAGDSHGYAATARRDGEALRLALYRDGREVAAAAPTVALPFRYAVAAPFYVGTTADGDPADPALTGALTGHVYGAVVRDYVAADAYLATPSPLDFSGPYLGLPAYYDAPLADGALPLDRRLDAAPLPVRYRFFLPFMNDDYIPQGTATAWEGVGDDDTPVVFVAYYHRTGTGTTGLQASLVAEIDATTGHLRRAFRLRGRLGSSHAGGIAFVKDALYVSSEGWLERYPLPAYAGPDADVFLDLEADVYNTIEVESKASFVSAFQDTLWVGDYRQNSDPAPYLYGYPLDDAGLPSRTEPYVAYAIPRYVQGVDLFATGGQTYVFLSRNRGSSAAEVMRFRREQLDLYSVAAPDTAVTFPHGIEDLSFFPDGTLWTNSESGAEYYQLQAGWDDFYPFVYGVPASELFPGPVDTGREAPDAGPDLGLSAYPNPARGGATVAYALSAPGPVRITVVDALGRTVAALADGAVPAGPRTLYWDARALAGGLYFVVLESASGRVARPVTLLN